MSRARIYLLLILLIAVFFRLNNLNWDSGFHLHPDERFLTMVGNAMKMPESFSDYLNPAVSGLNPANVGFKFYVYGAFPLILNKTISVLIGSDDYNLFTLQGRFLSGLADLLVVILVYKTAQLLTKQRHNVIPLFAAFFYAIAVLPIQHAHFFVVDPFLNLFMFASFYFALKYSFQKVKSKVTFLSSAIFFGLALATKITAFFILPLNLYFLLSVDFKKIRENIFKFALLCFIYVLASYVVLRLADPYLFESGSWLNPTPNKTFVSSLNTLNQYSGRDVWYPPGVQWLNKPPIIFSLVNLVFFGLGIPYFFFVLYGVWKIFQKNVLRYTFRVMILWVLFVFLYQSTRFAQTMRYFIFLYPFLAIFAAFGIEKVRSYKLRVISVILVLIWPLMFASICLNKHSRVEASEWIYKNLPSGSLILGEYWDDPLPLPLKEDYDKQFIIEQLHVFDPDNEDKWQNMDALLESADYYILSSNRGWGSIPTVPERYPKMSKFYGDLFDGKTRYKKIKEFTSYPRLEIGSWKLEISDDIADESFTVYDHPKVLIFKKY